jgi:hypothetical protein
VQRKAVSVCTSRRRKLFLTMFPKRIAAGLGKVSDDRDAVIGRSEISTRRWRVATGSFADVREKSRCKHTGESQ